MKRLEGTSAVITGAAGGIGRASAPLLAQHGARLVLVDRAAAGVQETAHLVRQDGGTALALVRDAASEVDGGLSSSLPVVLARA